MRTWLLASLASLILAGCGDSSSLPERSGLGANPELPKPQQSWFPTIDIAPAVGWKDGKQPKPADGLKLTRFAQGLDHPRWLYVLPNGDVLVAETNAPYRPDEYKGVRGWAMSVVMNIAGATVPSANRISLLRDADGDGVAETKTKFADNLNSPYGMVLVGSTLYVANTDAVVAFAYSDGQTSASAPPRKIADLPAGTLNHHWTKNIIANPDGSKLYVTVGSNSNVGENGMDKEAMRAAILEVDPPTGKVRLFASGLRNPNGLAFDASGKLWTVVNERDELGHDLVPDYLTSVQDGGFYGWPYSYFGQNVDTRIKPERPDLVKSAIVPEYALGAHTASLGLVFADGSRLGPQFAEGAFIGQHGSWNRTPPSGYKVIFVPFKNGQPAAEAQDVLTGFLSADGNAQGRPVGVVIDKRGGLLVADDVGNTVWRVEASNPTAFNQAPLAGQ